MSIFHTLLVIVAVSSVAVADIFLKKTQALGSMERALSSPWLVAAVALYLFQIIFFTYLFISGARLTHVGILQTVFYALIVLFAGVFLFGETLTPVQTAGVVLALLGVILLYL